MSNLVATNSLTLTIRNQLTSVDNSSTITQLSPLSYFFRKRDIVPFLSPLSLVATKLVATKLSGNNIFGDY